MKVLWITICVASLIGSTLQQTLPVQSHSFNDVDYLTQQLIKGVDAIKIDVSAMTKKNCLQFSTWNTNLNQCEYDMYDAEICCLSLRGDCASGPIDDDYYNTTDDLIGRLRSGQLDFVLKKDVRDPRYQNPVYIAINLQYPADKGSLTKRFFYDLISTIQDRNLDLHLLVNLGIKRYFQQICEQSCDHESQTIADFDFIGQSASHSSSDPEIKNLNFPFPSLNEFCESGFPAFGDPTPYFFYEFSHQEDVYSVVNLFLSDQCKRRDGHQTIDSIRLTSNVDPELIQSYLFQMQNSIELTMAKGFFTDIFEDDQSILLIYFDQNQQKTMIQTRSLNNASMFSVLTSQVLDLDSPVLKFAFNAPFLLAVTSDNQQIVYKVTKDDSSTDLVIEQYASTQFNALLIADVVNNQDSVKMVGLQKSDSCNGLTFFIADVQDSSQIQTQCVNFDMNGVLNYGIDSVFLDGKVHGLALVSKSQSTVENQIKPVLYGFPFVINYDGSSFDVTQPLSYFDFGDQPNVKIVHSAADDQIYLFETHTDGMNQNGAFLNNGVTFKCGIPTTQFSSRARLQSIKYMMNYNWGRMEEFIAKVQSGQKLSACDDQIFHAKFGNGNNPNGIIYRATDGYLKGLVVNEHIDYFLLPTNTKLFFGSNLPGKVNNTNLIDVHQFDIVDYSIFNHI